MRREFRFATAEEGQFDNLEETVDNLETDLAEPLALQVNRSQDILGLVGLKDRVSFLPGEMSGGEQQRVAIARVLVNNPTILLADEPCANLDTRNSTTILELIRKLNKDLNQTVVMVSHEEWHRKYFDRIISMRDGKIVTDEDPEKEYSHESGER